LAGDGWLLACCLNFFGGESVCAASSNLIWRYELVEGLRSNATVTVTP
jgi:hypothetical protein